ncbi:hypothetical protein HYPSUDRAFT_858037 [Hypholoma sublateritium FD-334 SS-4]|uniref:Uncharacterized protein n=1 Tax=Hypholoma sublateritium (strain FD-334 SS-4) TaxID=945553 RepID=A0A0D2PHK8_HYPSF|nr:hypothetical protein HYPSUDRAFT_858037 [Hypholoma sublateritium FD-334 SS-4]
MPSVHPKPGRSHLASFSPPAQPRIPPACVLRVFAARVVSAVIDPSRAVPFVSCMWRCFCISVCGFGLLELEHKVPIPMGPSYHRPAVWSLACSVPTSRSPSATARPPSDS